MGTRASHSAAAAASAKLAEEGSETVTHRAPHHVDRVDAGGRVLEVQHFAEQDNAIWVVKGVLSPEDCAAYIARGEREGFQEATVDTGAPGGTMMKGLRDNDRATFEDAAFAAELFARVRAFLPELASGLEPTYTSMICPSAQTRAGMRLRELNPRLRVYKYTAGQRFAMHRDGVVHYLTPSPGAEDVEKIEHVSFVTVMFYLNDVEASAGGATKFFHEDHRSETQLQALIQPRAGDCLMFVHRLLHAGAPCTSSKYVLRTDAMYAHAVPAREEDSD